MASNRLQSTTGRGTYVFGWFNDAGDRGFTKMGKQLNRMAKHGPDPFRQPLKGAAKTLKRSDLGDVPTGIYNTIRRHPYSAIVIGTAAVYLVQRMRQR